MPKRSPFPGVRPGAYPALAVALALTLFLAPRAIAGQEDIRVGSEQVVTLPVGGSALLTRTDSITRVSIANPNVGDYIIFPPNEVLINGVTPGATTMIVWGATGVPRFYTVEVTADVASLQRQIDELFPDAGLQVRSTGSSVVLTGQVRDPQTVRKATELAETMGIPIVNNIQSPAPEQILLHVEFAEISRSALKQMGTDLLRILNPQNFNEWDGDNTDYELTTFAEGLVDVMVTGENSQLQAALRLLRANGDFKSLAQPNLVTREGQEASFLAGGEFPYPTIQGAGGNNNNAVTIQFREFGIRLNFLPTITNSGNVRLQVEPEVSSLDFANGVTFQGFQIPSLLTRRVQTDVELAPGQTLAIGGLLDSTISSDLNKFPILGDIPILGYFFRSEEVRQNRSELLVLVTPYILDPDNLPAPPLPTGPAESWDWDSHIGEWLEADSARVRLGDPPVNDSIIGGGGNDRR
ncbi:MAG: pilus assembly protein N-terminal domain-containing protein [Gemmatimonadota bacterium]|jgi:pilus assembly protein CpaC